MRAAAQEHAMHYGRVISRCIFLTRDVRVYRFRRCQSRGSGLLFRTLLSSSSIMQLVIYSRLNAVLYSARQSIVFHFDILLHDGRLARDNEYGYLTGSSNVNKAASFQASARRSFGVKISRYEREADVGREIPRAEFLRRARV